MPTDHDHAIDSSGGPFIITLMVALTVALDTALMGRKGVSPLVTGRVESAGLLMYPASILDVILLVPHLPHLPPTALAQVLLWWFLRLALLAVLARR